MFSVCGPIPPIGLPHTALTEEKSSLTATCCTMDGWYPLKAHKAHPVSEENRGGGIDRRGGRTEEIEQKTNLG